MTPAQPPPAESPPPVAVAPATAPAPPAEDEEDDEIHADPLTRQQYVPLGTLAKAREKAKAHKQQAETLSEQVKNLEAQAKQAADAVRQWQDYANTLRQSAPPAQPAVQQVDPRVDAERDKAQKTRAAQLAKRYDWYTSGGDLDVDRGLEELADREREIRERAEEIASARVQPLTAHVARQTIQQRQGVLNQRLQELGIPINREYLNQLAQMLPDQLLMDGNTHLLVNAAAIGQPLLQAILAGDEAKLKDMGFTPAAARQIVKQAAQPEVSERTGPVVTESVSQHAPPATRFS